MKEIEKHLGHVSQLETHVHGAAGDPDCGISKITVDCTRCGVEVATIFDAQEGCNEDLPVYLKAVISAGSANKSTFALICLEESIIDELLSIRQQLLDLSEQGVVLRVHSFNLARIGEMNLADDEVVVLKDYDAVDGGDDWNWLHEEVLSPNPPDDFLIEVGGEKWDRLTEMPNMNVGDIRCIATKIGVYWEIDASGKDWGEVFCTFCLPWSSLERFWKEVNGAEDHQ